MTFGICNMAVTPMRAEPSHRSEMVSQMLFGETCEILKTSGDWMQIRSLFDDYEGFVDTKSLVDFQESDLENHLFQAMAGDLCNLLIAEDGPYVLPLGAMLPVGNREFFLGDKHANRFVYEGEYFPASSMQSLAETAHLYLNTPYLWGGKSSFGIDCSGFVQQVYKLHGIKLPRDAYQQATYGEVLSFLEEAVPGDLAFFDNEEGKITHVGILLEDRKIIHAHGKVRIDVLDHGGIFNKDTQKHSHKLRFLRHIERP